MIIYLINWESDNWWLKFATILNKTSIYVDKIGVITFLNVSVHEWLKKEIELPKIIIYHFGGEVQLGNITLIQYCLYAYPFGVENIYVIGVD